MVFGKNQKVLNLDVETRLDTWVEPVHYFGLGLYTNENDPTVLTTGSAYIQDTFIEPDKYTIVNSSTNNGTSNGIALSQLLCW